MPEKRYSRLKVKCRWEECLEEDIPRTLSRAGTMKARHNLIRVLRAVYPKADLQSRRTRQVNTQALALLTSSVGASTAQLRMAHYLLEGS